MTYVPSNFFVCVCVMSRVKTLKSALSPRSHELTVQDRKSSAKGRRFLPRILIDQKKDARDLVIGCTVSLEISIRYL
jgi:hypothetical protein